MTHYDPDDFALLNEAEEAQEEDIRETIRLMEQENPALDFFLLPLGACPMQAEGDYEGEDDFYFRFRYDKASLTFRGKTVVKEHVTGEPLAGVLTGSEFRALFTRMLKAALDA